MSLFLKLKKRLLLRRYPGIRDLLEEVDLSSPVEEAVFTVFDTETTGLDPKKAELVSIGALKVQNLQIDLSSAFHRFLKPSRLEVSSVEIHGITWEELEKKGEEPRAVVEDFLRYVRGTVLVGFNVEFDRRVVERYSLRYLGIPLPNYRVDVFRIWKSREGQGKDLQGMARELDIPIQGVHSALDDAYITALLFLRLVWRMRKEPLRSLPLVL